MTDSTVALRTAAPDDLDRVESLLAANDLPHGDVDAGSATFYLASVDGEVVGVGGLEVHSSDGLLRSVVLEDAARGRGLGTALVESLESEAVDAGVDSLYLLTTTAQGFFRGCGYEVIAREEAPPEIRRTSEFRDLCPDSATCMRRDLRPPNDSGPDVH